MFHLMKKELTEKEEWEREPLNPSHPHCAFTIWRTWSKKNRLLKTILLFSEEYCEFEYEICSGHYLKAKDSGPLLEGKTYKVGYNE